jgi:mannosyltransferase OCH1-like enzyme
LHELGDTEEAYQIYRSAEARFSGSAEVRGERVRMLRETGELYQALAEARQACIAYPAHFSRWSDLFDLELKLSPIDAAQRCLEEAPVQSRAEAAHHLTARARLALRIQDNRQAITLLEQTLRLQANHRGAIGQLFLEHFKDFNIDEAADYHARMSLLDAPARRVRGTTTNASQSHEGQMLNDLLIDRQAVTELVALKTLDPVRRISALLPLVRKRPDHIPTATMVLVTLRKGNLFNRPTEAAVAGEGRRDIPKLIGQYWDAEKPPPDLLELSKSWRDRNPDHQYVLFDDRTAQAYLVSCFPPAVVNAYRHCTDATTKADLFRLAFLTREGGVWADMDDRCITALSEVIPASAEACFWQETTGTLCNNFMAAKPGHPILRRAFAGAVNAINRGDRDKVWMLTGPGLLSRAFVADMAEAGESWPDYLSRITVLDEFAIWSHVAIHCQASYKKLGNHWMKTAYSESQGAPKTAFELGLPPN